MSRGQTRVRCAGGFVPLASIPMTEHTTRDLMRHQIRDLHEPTRARGDDHDRVPRRAGDVERATTCEELADHFAAGRLSREELEHRLSWAVRAVTEEDLWRLLADLPRIPGPPTPPPPPAGAAPTWSASVVLAVVALVLSVAVAGVMLLVLGAINPLLFVGACLGGGAAVVAGVSGCYLITRHRRAAETPRSYAG